MIPAELRRRPAKIGYARAQSSPGAFIDIAQGGNALFGGSCCPARPDYDLATGLGSPMANQIAALLGG